MLVHGQAVSRYNWPRESNRDRLQTVKIGPWGPKTRGVQKTMELLFDVGIIHDQL